MPQNFPPLGAIKWHRLVLDEAHTVKNAAVAHSKACMALQADRRWLCTGAFDGPAAAVEAGGAWYCGWCLFVCVWVGVLVRLRAGLCLNFAAAFLFAASASPAPSTGTPINTDVGDLFGQFAVLGFSPYNIKVRGGGGRVVGGCGVGALRKAVWCSAARSVAFCVQEGTPLPQIHAARAHPPP